MGQHAWTVAGPVGGGDIFVRKRRTFSRRIPADSVVGKTKLHEFSLEAAVRVSRAQLVTFGGGSIEIVLHSRAAHMRNQFDPVVDLESTSVVVTGKNAADVEAVHGFVDLGCIGRCETHAFPQWEMSEKDGRPFRVQTGGRIAKKTKHVFVDRRVLPIRSIRGVETDELPSVVIEVVIELTREHFLILPRIAFLIAVMVSGHRVNRGIQLSQDFAHRDNARDLADVREIPQCQTKRYRSMRSHLNNQILHHRRACLTSVMEIISNDKLEHDRQQRTKPFSEQLTTESSHISMQYNACESPRAFAIFSAMREVILVALLVSSILGVNGAGLDLICEFDGKRSKVLSLDGETIRLDDHRTVLLTDEGLTWSIGGVIADNTEYLAWSPAYRIERHVSGNLRPVSGIVWASSGTKYPGNPQFRGGKPNPAWMNRGSVDGLVVFAWLTGSEITQLKVSHAALEDGGLSRTASGEFDLSLAERAGQGVVLVWSKGEFIKPVGRSEDKQVQQAIVSAMLNDAGNLEHLLKAGVDPNVKIDDDLTLMHFAAEAGALDSIEVLIGFKAKRLGKGRTPMHWAAMKGRAQTVERLIEAKHNKNAVDGSGRTPLMRAVEYGHREVAEVLVARKARVNTVADGYRTALGIAIDRGDAEIAELLHSHRAHVSFTDDQTALALISQCYLGHNQMVDWLVKNGVDPNFARKGTTALIAAASENDAELVRILVASGADPNLEPDHGMLPLHLAARRGNIEVVEALLDLGADPQLESDEGFRAIHYAAMSDSPSAVEMLVELGSPIDAKNARGGDPLMIALATGARKSARCLASLGAEIDSDNEHFEEFLGRAICMDLGAVIEKAIEDGWAPDSELPGEWPALRLAQIFNANRCVDVLERAGASDPGDVPVPVVGVVNLDERIRPVQVAFPDEPRLIYEEFPEMTVKVSALLDRDGLLRYPVIEDAPDPRLARSTLRALGNWRFQPPVSRGKPAAARVLIPIVFPSSEGRDYAVSDVDVCPVPKTRVGPRYPEAARNRGEQAAVELSFVVSENGSVKNIRVERATGPEFAEAAISALKQWEFEPGLLDGKPVPVRMRLPFRFNLRNEEIRGSSSVL